jgi:hypothetical protein
MANASPAWADLIGTSVSGVLTASGSGNTNWFDSSVAGAVLAGFGNSAPHGPNNVVISASQIEFGSTIGIGPGLLTHLTADFTDNALDVTISGFQGGGEHWRRP